MSQQKEAATVASHPEELSKKQTKKQQIEHRGLQSGDMMSFKVKEVGNQQQQASSSREEEEEAECRMELTTSK